MNYAIESFTGIRPTADLTVANYIGAVRPVLDRESDGQSTSIFLAELHAITTAPPADVIKNSRELGRTLIASGLQGDIYSQREVQDLVFEAEHYLLGLTSISRLLRLPTLKEKVTQSDNTENATVGLAMYPMLMASDIILARPAQVPTGKDQKPHLEITNELIRGFNRQHGARLPEPRMLEVELPKIMSLDGSGRKMSKSIPKGAIFLDDTPLSGFKKVMKAVTASEPGPVMDSALDNMITMVTGLGTESDIAGLKVTADQIREGQPCIKDFKEQAGDAVRGFLTDMQERRASVSDSEVSLRILEGSERFRPIGQATLNYMRDMYWSR
ncbi:MAG TPA: hypothetical protein VF575_00850 [Candidatus Saccharimonadales bacterium]|jgi:tryptophanyl-tRNA synthetase